MCKVNGKGSIFQLDKKKPRAKCRHWQVRVSTGFNHRTGKYGTRSKNLFGSYSDAQQALRDLIQAVENNELVSCDTLFSDYAKHFMKEREESRRFARSTQRGVGHHLEAATMHLGTYQMGEIKPKEVKAMLYALMAGDSPSGKHLKESYITGVLATTKLVFDMAMDEELLPANPCLKVKVPTGEVEPRRSLRPQDMRRFIDALDCTVPRQCGYLLAVVMGLRRGEICGLSWEDVDFENKTMYVRHSYDEFNEMRPCKTRAGLRNLPIPDIAMENLQLLHKQEEELLGEELTGETPVLRTFHGERYNPNDLTALWCRDRAKFGLAGWTFHELRHTYISMLALNGVHPKVMQMLAGHASAKLTMDVYTHINMDSKIEATEVFENALEELKLEVRPEIVAA